MLAACTSSAPPTDESRLRLHSLSSTVFGNERVLRVWLPEEYNRKKATRYPVLYLNDGQNVFDSSTSMFNPLEWRADELVDSLVAAHVIPSIIVVGIDNAGREHRAREYLPYPDAYLSPPEPEPQGGRYGAFLTRDVFPFVDTRYRTDSTVRVLGGSSYGALVAAYVAVSTPGAVRRLLLESPSLYVNERQILRDLEAAPLRLERVYLGIGTNELGESDCGQTEGNLEAVSDVQRLAAQFEADSNQSLQVHTVITPCAIHDEGAWSTRLPGALRFLFGPAPPRSNTR